MHRSPPVSLLAALALFLCALSLARASCIVPTDVPVAQRGALKCPDYCYREVNGAAVLNLDCDCCALAPNKPGDFTIAGVGAPLGDKLKRLERVEEGLKKQYPGTPH